MNEVVLDQIIRQQERIDALEAENARLKSLLAKISLDAAAAMVPRLYDLRDAINAALKGTP